jgi:hypothetical protein
MSCVAWIVIAATAATVSGAPPALVRSAASGHWSEPRTWEGGAVPSAGDRVQIRAGHVVTYDTQTERPFRSVHIAGTLRFPPDRDTRLDVGLIKIERGDDPSESVSGCEGHLAMDAPLTPRPALEVGTRERPIARGRSALIRLAQVDGLDPQETPAIICCGGRMEFHGQPLERTWVKLGAPAAKGDSTVAVLDSVVGWKRGDRVILTATNHAIVRDEGDVPSLRESPRTEERIIEGIAGVRITLDRPLSFDHEAGEHGRGEVANLSRNVVVESANPDVARGHTMVHKHSAGSIRYAEFRHLGKPGQLGKYSLHFHRVGDTMRGSEVRGVSIWDSANRFVTIHGSDYLIVRDCVGYRSLGHGFFLEDGTEVNNWLDGNLAVLVCGTRPLPGQSLAFDRNDGAGFWWANSGNAFTRNVAVECDEYGFRYDAPAGAGFDPALPVRDPDGVRRPRDIRTIPFIRFEANEAHTQRRYGVNLGGASGVGKSLAKDGKDNGGVGGIGPDSRHPFVVRRLKVWDAHWALTPAAPGLMIDDANIAYSDFGLWRPNYERQAHRGLRLFRTRWPSTLETGTRPSPSDFPRPLEPVDDAPPITTILQVTSDRQTGHVVVRGVAVDDGEIRAVRVNGRSARPLQPDFSEWEVTLDTSLTTALTLTALAEDAAGNLEKNSHHVVLGPLGSPPTSSP